VKARLLLAGFDRAVAAVAGALLVGLLGIVTLGIVTRALGRPFSWTDEMSGYLMVWVSCLGWILATRHHAHIRIRYFQDRLPAGGWRAVEAAIQLALLAAGLVVGYESILLVARNLDIEAVSIPVSTAWIYAPLIPAGFVTAAQALADLAGLARRAPAAPDASA
jgi:TRAP-type C4-dicarboxylate transport system permease small subunit